MTNYKKHEDPQNIIKKLKESTKNEAPQDTNEISLKNDRESLVKRFENYVDFSALSEDDIGGIEAQLIELLHDTKNYHDNNGRVIRSYVPLFLKVLKEEQSGSNGGKIAGDNSFDAMINRLKDEEEHDVVKEWCIRILLRSFEKGAEEGKKILDWIIDHEYNTQQVIFNQWVILTEIGQKDDKVVFEKLIEAIQYNGFELPVVTAIQQLKNNESLLKPQERRNEAVTTLLGYLNRNNHADVKDVSGLMAYHEKKRLAVEAITAIGTRNDSEIITKELLKYLNGPDLKYETEDTTEEIEKEKHRTRVAMLETLGYLGDQNNKRLIDILIAFIGGSDQIIILNTCNALVNILTEKGAVEAVIDYGLNKDNEHKADKFGYALRVISPEYAVDQLKMVNENAENYDRAWNLLKEMGGKYAYNAIENRLKDANKLFDRVHELTTESFNRLSEQKHKSFNHTLLMSKGIFVIGMVVFCISFISFFTEFDFFSNTNSMLPGEGIGMLSGLTTMLIIFFKQPVKQVDNAVSSNVQTSIVTLGYFQQLGQIRAMVEARYLKGDPFTLEEINGLLKTINSLMEESMSLSQRCTALNGNTEAVNSELTALRNKISNIEKS